MFIIIKKINKKKKKKRQNYLTIKNNIYLLIFIF